MDTTCCDILAIENSFYGLSSDTSQIYEWKATIEKNAEKKIKEYNFVAKIIKLTRKTTGFCDNEQFLGIYFNESIIKNPLTHKEAKNNTLKMKQKLQEMMSENAKKENHQENNKEDKKRESNLKQRLIAGVQAFKSILNMQTNNNETEGKLTKLIKDRTEIATERKRNQSCGKKSIKEHRRSLSRHDAHLLKIGYSLAQCTKISCELLKTCKDKDSEKKAVLNKRRSVSNLKTDKKILEDIKNINPKSQTENKYENLISSNSNRKLNPMIKKVIRDCEVDNINLDKRKKMFILLNHLEYSHNFPLIKNAFREISKYAEGKKSKILINIIIIDFNRKKSAKNIKNIFEKNLFKQTINALKKNMKASKIEEATTKLKDTLNKTLKFRAMSILHEKIKISKKLEALEKHKNKSSKWHSFYKWKKYTLSIKGAMKISEQIKKKLKQFYNLIKETKSMNKYRNALIKVSAMHLLSILTNVTSRVIKSHMSLLKNYQILLSDIKKENNMEQVNECASRKISHPSIENYQTGLKKLRQQITVNIKHRVEYAYNQIAKYVFKKDIFEKQARIGFNILSKIWKNKIDILIKLLRNHVKHKENIAIKLSILDKKINLRKGFIKIIEQVECVKKQKCAKKIINAIAIIFQKKFQRFQKLVDLKFKASKIIILVNNRIKTITLKNWRNLKIKLQNRLKQIKKGLRNLQNLYKIRAQDSFDDIKFFANTKKILEQKEKELCEFRNKKDNEYIRASQEHIKSIQEKDAELKITQIKEKILSVYMICQQKIKIKFDCLKYCSNQSVYIISESVPIFSKREECSEFYAPRKVSENWQEIGNEDTCENFVQTNLEELKPRVLKPINRKITKEHIRIKEYEMCDSNASPNIQLNSIEESSKEFILSSIFGSNSNNKSVFSSSEGAVKSISVLESPTNGEGSIKISVIAMQGKQENNVVIKSTNNNEKQEDRSKLIGDDLSSANMADPLELESVPNIVPHSSAQSNPHKLDEEHKQLGKNTKCKFMNALLKYHEQLVGDQMADYNENDLRCSTPDLYSTKENLIMTPSQTQWPLSEYKNKLTSINKKQAQKASLYYGRQRNYSSNTFYSERKMIDGTISTVGKSVGCSNLLSNNNRQKEENNHIDINKQFIIEMSDINHEINKLCEQQEGIPRMKIPKPELVFKMAKYKNHLKKKRK